MAIYHSLFGVSRIWAFIIISISELFWWIKFIPLFVVVIMLLFVLVFLGFSSSVQFIEVYFESFLIMLAALLSILTEETWITIWIVIILILIAKEVVHDFFGYTLGLCSWYDLHLNFSIDGFPFILYTINVVDNLIFFFFNLVNLLEDIFDIFVNHYTFSCNLFHVILLPNRIQSL